MHAQHPRNFDPKDFISIVGSQFVMAILGFVMRQQIYDWTHDYKHMQLHITH